MSITFINLRFDLKLSVQTLGSDRRQNGRKRLEGVVQSKSDAGHLDLILDDKSNFRYEESVEPHLRPEIGMRTQLLYGGDP